MENTGANLILVKVVLINGLRTAVGTINMILMAITLVLQFVAFNALRHVILCSCVLLLVTVELVLDRTLKNSKLVTIRGCCYALWSSNLSCTCL